MDGTPTIWLGESELGGLFDRVGYRADIVAWELRNTWGGVSLCGEAADGHFAEDFLLFVGASDDLFESADEFLLIVD